MSKPLVIIQREVGKDVLQDLILSNIHFDIMTFTVKDILWQSYLHKAMAVFCSIEHAKQTTRINNGPLWLPHKPNTEGIMNWNWYSNTIPSDILLNPNTTIMPFGHILKNEKQLIDQYGDNLFLKPNSPWKPFTGLSVHKDNLQYELASLIQLEYVRPQELVIITDKKDIHKIEYRCWCINGKVVTSAPYSWDTMETIVDTPKEVVDIAEKAAYYLWEYDSCMVIDVAITEEGNPKVIELNAFSTSGWYLGMDVTKLLLTMKEIF